MEQSNLHLIKLKEFYVFNSTITSADIDVVTQKLNKEKLDTPPKKSETEQNPTDEDELAKIIYYYPPGTDTNTKLNKVGLCEAIIKFTENFHSQPSCDSVNTQKARYVFLEPEPNYWFVIVLTVPSITKITSDGLEVIEYLSDSLQDNVYKALLKQLYQKFTFLHDTLEKFIVTNGLKQLRIRLGRFLDSALPKIDVHNCGIHEIFHGLQFQPLDRQLFLDFQCFCNRLLLEFPDVSKVLFYQQDKLIWCGISQSDVLVFNDYFIRDLIPKVNRESTRIGFVYKKESHITLHSDICADMNHSHSSNNDKIVPERERYHLVIYKTEDSFLIILVHGSVALSQDLMSSLDSYLSVNLTPIAKKLTLVPAVDLPSSSNVKFIYFNNLNLAEKSTLSPLSSSFELEAYKLLADLKSDLAVMNKSGNGEIVVKMLGDCWIVAKVSNHREFYAIFNNKGSNLLEIEDELKKLTDVTLNNIFFQD